VSLGFGLSHPAACSARIGAVAGSWTLPEAGGRRSEFVSVGHHATTTILSASACGRTRNSRVPRCLPPGAKQGASRQAISPDRMPVLHIVRAPFAATLGQGTERESGRPIQLSSRTSSARPYAAWNTTLECRSDPAALVVRAQADGLSASACPVRSGSRPLSRSPRIGIMALRIVGSGPLETLPPVFAWPKRADRTRSPGSKRPGHLQLPMAILRNPLRPDTSLVDCLDC